MPSILSINIIDLLQARGVESARLEFKAAWNPASVGLQVLHTVCAFANDLQNLNGGYIIIGVQAQDGVAQLPPVGIAPSSLDDIQRWIRGRCNTIDPIYQPVLSPEVVDGRHILVIWAPGSDSRPHQASESLDKGSPRKFWVRLGSETVDAKGDLLTQLLQMTAKVPFDDRRAMGVPVEKLRESRVREFLTDVRSDLVLEHDAREIYRRMYLTSPANGHELPRNVGLLFFSDEPEEWFRGARIEVVQFASDSSGNVIAEQTFRGPLQHQLRTALDSLRTLSIEHLEKLRNQPEVKGWVSYPIPAVEEALVNAVYHRSYENQPEPTKVYFFPDRMEIISYPGPVPGIHKQHLVSGAHIPPVPARNRRIGEYLKELRPAEGRGTGIPKVFRSMEQNGSPEPTFDFDEQRTFFRVTIPAHPEYTAIVALRDAAHLRAIGDPIAALDRLRSAFNEHPSSETLAATLITDLARERSIDEAREVFNTFLEHRAVFGGARVIVAMSNTLLDTGRRQEAVDVLNRLPATMSPQDAVEAAIAEKRAGRQQEAHRYFLQTSDAITNDVRALHEFAQTKIRIAKDILRGRRSPYERDAAQRLLREARPMLERVLGMDAAPTRHAWAWFNLAEVLKRLGATRSEIRHALEQAEKLAPNETRFAAEIGRLDSGS